MYSFPVLSQSGEGICSKYIYIHAWKWSYITNYYVYEKAI